MQSFSCFFGNFFYRYRGPEYPSEPRKWLEKMDQVPCCFFYSLCLKRFKYIQIAFTLIQGLIPCEKVLC